MLSLNHRQTGCALQLLEVPGSKPSSHSSRWEANNSPSGKSFASAGSRSRSLPPESWELGLWDITGPERQRDRAQTTSRWHLEMLPPWVPPHPRPLQAAWCKTLVQDPTLGGGAVPH